MVRNGPQIAADQCPLVGAKQKLQIAAVMSADEPGAVTSAATYNRYWSLSARRGRDAKRIFIPMARCTSDYVCSGYRLRIGCDDSVATVTALVVGPAPAAEQDLISLERMSEVTAVTRMACA
jgi:hypothetical protein